VTGVETGLVVTGVDVEGVLGVVLDDEDGDGDAAAGAEAGAAAVEAAGVMTGLLIDLKEYHADF
jgi:hypothetical protein